MLAKPYLIGIAGPSCSGKTALSHAIGGRLRATIIGLDSYYRDLSHLEIQRRARVNFDTPEMLDHTVLCEQLRCIAAGRPIAKPVYDFATHTRSRHIENVDAAEVVIVEGLYALHWKEVRALFRTKVYISARYETCFERRLDRDVKERGRTPESVERQYRDTVQPMCERFVVPTMHFADLVVSGTESLDRNAEAVLRHVSTAPYIPRRQSGMMAAYA